MKTKLTFEKRARLAFDALSKQKPVTLNYARTQVLWLKIGSKSNKHMEQDVKHHLEMYHPKWTKVQIDKEYVRILEIKNMSVEDAVNFIYGK